MPRLDLNQPRSLVFLLMVQNPQTLLRLKSKTSKLAQSRSGGPWGSTATAPSQAMTSNAKINQVSFSLPPPRLVSTSTLLPSSFLHCVSTAPPHTHKPQNVLSIRSIPCMSMSRLLSVLMFSPFLSDLAGPQSRSPLVLVGIPANTGLPMGTNRNRLCHGLS